MKQLFKLTTTLLILVTVFACASSDTDTTDVSEEDQTETVDTPTESDDFASLSGSYKSEFGTVTINYLSDGKYEFDILTADASGCTGELAGEATLNNDKTAIYTAEGCEELAFSFTDEGLDIKETACDETHGMRCGFSDLYTKAE